MRMKQDPDFDAAAAPVYKVAAADLRQFIERVERTEASIKEEQEARKEIYVKVLKKLIALRKREPADVSEEEAVLDLYRDALGM